MAKTTASSEAYLHSSITRRGSYLGKNETFLSKYLNSMWCPALPWRWHNFSVLKALHSTDSRVYWTEAQLSLFGGSVCTKEIDRSKYCNCIIPDFRKFAEIFASQGAPPVSTTPEAHLQKPEVKNRDTVPLNNLKFSDWRIFSIWHRCHLELRIFSQFFETAPIVFSEAWGKLIHEKNQKLKISWHCPFKSFLLAICNLYTIKGNLKSENSQDHAQKLQQNCTFKNSASVLITYSGFS